MADSTRWNGTERRTNTRMRVLIDELRNELRDTRLSLEFLRERVSTIAVELEVLKRAGHVARPSADNLETQKTEHDQV